ncbi:hypothetical protein TNCV_1354241 [Trichonephila clavipes]|nr:hypothetical protein TNCV_1354241 [Trichonephila clavipes]
MFIKPNRRSPSQYGGYDPRLVTEWIRGVRVRIGSKRERSGLNVPPSRRGFDLFFAATTDNTERRAKVGEKRNWGK